MKSFRLPGITATVFSILFCADAVFGQTMLLQLKDKKSLWRGIVDQKLPDVKGWNAGFPTERKVDKNKPDTFSVGGDSLMYAALLCSSGETSACSVIPNSLELSGQLRRNPLLKGQPNTSNYGRLSKDHVLATLLWLTLPDNIVPYETKRNFALNWQKSFDQPVTDAAQCDNEKMPLCLTGNKVDPVDLMIENSSYDLSAYLGQNLNLDLGIKLPPLSVDTIKTAVSNVGAAGQAALDRIAATVKDNKLAEILQTATNTALQSARTVEGCLTSTKGAEACIKDSIKAPQNYVTAIIAATALCTEGAFNTSEVGPEVGRCVFSMIAATLALPRVCEDINCVMSPTQMAYVNRVWQRLNLQAPFVSPVFDLLDLGSEELVMSSSFHNMNEAHLGALNVLLRRNLGMKNSKIMGRLTNVKQYNPFFQAISKNPVYTQESVAGLLIDQCRSIESTREGVVQYRAPLTPDFDHPSFWRWKTQEQNDFAVDANNFSERISMVWDCIYVANLLGVKEYPYLSAAPNVSFGVKVKKNENPTIYDTVAKVVSGGVLPLTYELLTRPTDFNYLSFDPASGVFIFRPVNSYFGGSFKFAVTDAIGRRVESLATITLDHSEIYPGHPPLTQPPVRPLPAAVNPLITITNAESNQSRTLDYTTTAPADLMIVKSGTLAIQAESFIENVDESYAGNMDCTVDWTGKGGKASVIKDADEFPRNFFIQKSIDVTSIEPYEVTTFRMNCLAPDMPISIKDIPIVYLPDAIAMKKSFDKAEYTYGSSSGATLKLVLNKGESDEFNKVFKYNLKNSECGNKNGTMVAATNANKLTIDGSFNGVLITGDSQKLAWIDVPLCEKTFPIVWKLISAGGTDTSNTGASCQYKHKKDTAGGMNGQTTFADAVGKTRSCDKNGDWKTSCKDSNSDTDEVGCDTRLPAPPPASMCQYKHKKDTSGGKNGQVTFQDFGGKTRSCDKSGDWKTICKDGNGDTDEVGCDTSLPKPTSSMCQYKHKKDTAGGKNGQTTSLDASGKSKTCDKSADWKAVCKDGNSDTDEVDCQ